MDHLIQTFPKILTIAAVAAVVAWEISQGYFRGWKTSWQQGGPLKLDATHAAVFCLLLGLMFFGDRSVRSLIQAYDDHSAVVAFSNMGHQLGRYLFVLLVSVYAAGLAMRSPAACRLVFGMLLTSVITALIVTVLKFTFLRARPFAELGPLSFFHLEGLLQDERTFQSFPSGDVAIVSGAAAYLFYVIRRPFLRWLPVFFLLSTAFSRVSRNRHWPSDTVGSILIALIVARAIAHLAQTAKDASKVPA